MPSGIYLRTEKAKSAQMSGLKLGRTKAVRERVRLALKLNAANPEWRKRVSEATKAAMHRPDVRQRHLMGLAGNLVNFKGGNGQPPVAKVLELSKKLEPMGFIRELAIPTRNHKTGHKPPPSYKVDFGHPARKVAVEVDGQSHHGLAKRALDEKKTEVLEALGWTVARVKH